MYFPFLVNLEPGQSIPKEWDRSLWKRLMSIILCNVLVFLPKFMYTRTGTLKWFKNQWQPAIATAVAMDLD